MAFYERFQRLGSGASFDGTGKISSQEEEQCQNPVVIRLGSVETESNLGDACHLPKKDKSLVESVSDA
jgi:hypothetical protein